MLTDAQKQIIIQELIFKTSRSGGKGGQHVNKVSSKVEIVFNVVASQAFNEDELKLLNSTLANKLDSNGSLHVVSQISRSQLVNKNTAISKLFALLDKSLVVSKTRKPTKVPFSVIQKRIDDKVVRSKQKSLRRKIDFKRNVD
ncbi:alternative ribosome rescue aminoacyl-tRNA hydrolase ArfB [Pedobacter flavus]|uniref:Alternative ribosome rescue aminoacyl-tRNA hydrolase ArfB n=1 Tax=Pedobacter flavus TaxID=3113906 RepID=A0ABU7GXQ9_9SPHI|nr:alternative ribosome rescue aminoacyl-tRNA hydrolase ArfB [Pedobacter sp. VNH31]MEE1883844.1 alternative ribosome rescue aminoacyl-tRNA hydrolase ArfB [Pedobacter sp. VNH31]